MIPKIHSVIYTFLLICSILPLGCTDDSELRYPDVDRVEVSGGKGYINVTIYGKMRGTENYISEVKVTVLGYEVFLIPVEHPPHFGLGGGDAMTPFKKTIRIDDLEIGEYKIYIITTDIDGNKFLITKTFTVY
ncbi:MAG: hypothetical protein QG588_181 [Candidatus Poribacteria bacterium]|nr:hypothetical protein [Candidatus Poribacteria bacterium]